MQALSQLSYAPVQTLLYDNIKIFQVCISLHNKIMVSLNEYQKIEVVVVLNQHRLKLHRGFKCTPSSSNNCKLL